MVHRFWLTEIIVTPNYHQYYFKNHKTVWSVCCMWVRLAWTYGRVRVNCLQLIALSTDVHASCVERLFIIEFITLLHNKYCTFYEFYLPEWWTHKFLSFSFSIKTGWSYVESRSTNIVFQLFTPLQYRFFNYIFIHSFGRTSRSGECNPYENLIFVFSLEELLFFKQ